MIKKLYALLLLAILMFCQINISAQNQSIDLEAVFQGKYALDNIKSLQWQPSTSNYSYVDDDHQIWIVNAKTGKKSIFIPADSLKAHNILGLRSFRWIDAHTIYIARNNCLVSYVDGKISVTGFDNINTEEVIDQSVKNQLFIIKNDKGVFVQSKLNGFKPILICPDTGSNIVFGESVHRSEWGINEGQYISLEANYIAFYRMDQSMVEDYPLVNTTTPIATVEMMKYPMAGRTNHQVKVGIYDVAASSKAGKAVYHYILADTANGEFFTNVTFSPDEKYLFITHLNRAQNHEKLIQYDVQTGKMVKILIEERDNRYVEPTHRLIFLKDNRFLWFSDRDGYNHLYLYDFDGNLIKQVVKGNFDIVDYYGMDAAEQNLYFTSPLNKAINQHVCKVNMKTGIVTNLTSADGTHYPLFNDSKTYFIDYFTNITTPRIISLFDTQGKLLNTLLTSKNPYKDCAMGTTTMFTIPNKEGDSLWCRMITPPNMDPGEKYPCLIYVYGGPHSQLVTNTFTSGGVFLEYLAEQGYVVFTLDNRGTANRGADFEKCIHRNLGVAEVEDQMCGVRYLNGLPFIDTTRIGLDGWSYGGFMVLSLITAYPDVFKAASCGGPVVNWAWYEIMYGERYMDTPQENPEGYANANIIPKIKNVKCPLLVMHGAQDHTVVWQNTLELLRQAVTDNIEIEYFVYTAHDHNVMGRERLHLWNKLIRFHDRNLKGE